MIYQVQKHIEFTQDCQGINLSEFSYNDDNTPNEIRLLNFITSRSYTYVSLSEIIKSNPEKEYLRQAFVTDLLKIEDFKKLSKQEVVEYLIDFSNTEDWGNDKKKFEILRQKFNDILSDIETDNFYIINIDWFEQGNIKIREPEHWIYGYYFLIFWIDNNLNKIGVAEWFAD